MSQSGESTHCVTLPLFCVLHLVITDDDHQDDRFRVYVYGGAQFLGQWTRMDLPFHWKNSPRMGERNTERTNEWKKKKVKIKRKTKENRWEIGERGERIFNWTVDSISELFLSPFKSILNFSTDVCFAIITILRFTWTVWLSLTCVFILPFYFISTVSPLPSFSPFLPSTSDLSFCFYTSLAFVCLSINSDWFKVNTQPTHGHYTDSFKWIKCEFVTCDLVLRGAFFLAFALQRPINSLKLQTVCKRFKRWMSLASLITLTANSLLLFSLGELLIVTKSWPVVDSISSMAHCSINHLSTVIVMSSHIVVVTFSRSLTFPRRITSSKTNGNFNDSHLILIFLHSPLFLGC